MSSEHQCYETPEQYAMGKLSGSAKDTLEEHLLLCQVCQEQLDEATGYVIAMRQAVMMRNRSVRQFHHDTEDGLIVSEVTRLGPGKWLA